MKEFSRYDEEKVMRRNNLYNILILTTNIDPFSELAKHLKEEFFNVSTLIVDGDEMKRYFDFEPYDLVLTDLHYPNGFHLDIVTRVAQMTQAPIIYFSNGFDDDKILEIFQSGATSHILFSRRVDLVAAKLKSILRFMHRMKKSQQDELQVGSIHIDLDNRMIKNREQQFPITSVEYRILRVLIEFKDQTISKDYLIHRVWDNDHSATDNALGIHITRLRKKLICEDEISLIETIWGVGYRLNLKHCQEAYLNSHMALK